MDHAAVILAGIIPNRRDNLLYALQHLLPEHFRMEQQRNLFQMLERYHDVGADIMPRKVLTDMLSRSGADAAKSLLYEALYDDAAAQDVEQHEFRYAVDALKDVRADNMTGEAITAGLEMLDRGLEMPDGQKLQGHAAAREFLYAELTKIDKMGSVESTPEGDMRLETKDMLAEYAARKQGAGPVGLTTGIGAIDRNGGLGPGELIFICAYTGEGKSQLTTQICWHTSVMLGKNAFFATSETVRPVVMKRLVARHTRLPMFGCPDGIDTKDLKNGTLSPEHEKVYQDALEDLHYNPAYGKIYVAQVPRGATLSYVEARMNRQAANFRIDVAAMDYLALLKADVRRQKSQEEYNDIIKDAGVMAKAHDGGRGVPLISPWAMSQQSWKKALGHDGGAGTGEYTLGSLAETSEAEKSCDQIMTLLRLPETPNEVKLQYLKMRDGDLPPPSTLTVDYRNAYLADKKVTSSSDLFDDGTYG